MGNNIETGVDRLVELVGQKKKISVSDAAKQLGVSKLVVTEWAEFLEKENLVTLEYSLSKTYLKPKELTDKEVEKHAKQFSNKKEAFVRKVDSALMQLERHHENAEQVKEEFLSLKKELGGEVDAVRGQLEELQKYEKAKKDIDSDIEKEFDKYHKQISDAHKLLDKEKKRFKSLIGELHEQEEALQEQEKSMESIIDLKESLSEKSEEITDLLKKAKKELKMHSSDVDDTHKHIDSLKKQIAKEMQSVDKIQTDKIDRLEEQRKKHEEEIAAMHKEISEQAKQAKQRISDDVQEGKKAASEFESFFNKRLDADKQLATLEKERKKMKDEYENLKAAIESFKVAGKYKTNDELEELQEKYDELDKKHSKYKKKLREITEHVFG